MTENESARRAAHGVFTEAWRFYRRCLARGLRGGSPPEAWAEAAGDMGETFSRFRGTPAERLANRVLGAVYDSFAPEKQKEPPT